MRMFATISLLFAVLLSFQCTKQAHLANVEQRDYYFDEEWKGEEDAEVLAIIQPYKDSMSQKLDQVIGHAADELFLGKPESTLGNFVSDAIEQQAEKQLGLDIDLVIQNHGGIRINSLAAGPITLRKVYEIMPFDNLLSVFELKGSALKDFADHMAIHGGWPVSEGFYMRIRGQEAVDIRINGQPLDTAAVYTVATNDFLANGGDDSWFLVEAANRKDYNVLIRDLIASHIRYLEDNGMRVNARIEGRIKTVEQ